MLQGLLSDDAFLPRCLRPVLDSRNLQGCVLIVGWTSFSSLEGEKEVGCVGCLFLLSWPLPAWLALALLGAPPHQTSHPRLLFGQSHSLNRASPTPPGERAITMRKTVTM